MEHGMDMSLLMLRKDNLEHKKQKLYYTLCSFQLFSISPTPDIGGKDSKFTGS